MSDAFVQLVLGLTPPFQQNRYGIKSPDKDPRERFVLFTLAYFANDDGVCTLRLHDLSAVTRCRVDDIREALRALEDKGFLMSRDHKNTREGRTYVLQTEVLIDEQFNRKSRERDSVFQLEAYGASRRTLYSIVRHGYTALVNLKRDPNKNGYSYISDGRAMSTIGELEELIELYRALPEEDRSEFGEWLEIRGVASRGGRLLLEAYDAWRDEQASEAAEELSCGST